MREAAPLDGDPEDECAPDVHRFYGLKIYAESSSSLVQVLLNLHACFHN